MERTVADFQARLESPWLAGTDQERFAESFAWAVARINTSVRPVMVTARDRVDYLAGVFAAVAQGRSVFLGNPDWGEVEWQQAAAVLPNPLNWLNEPPRVRGMGGGIDEAPASYRRGMMIPTGGTGGRVKFAVHSWETINVAVRGYAAFWRREALHAVCPLPVCHIGGLMLVWRTWLTGGRLWLADARLEGEPPAGFPLEAAHCSLVGAQLVRALDRSDHWLGRCEQVLVGGGPTALGLADRAQGGGIPLSIAYGLTEAAATVAIAKGGGSPGSPLGEILPHWRVSIESERIRLEGEALFQGYWGRAPRPDEPWATDDRGALSGNQLTVIGRENRIIVTGGKKVDADELERRLIAWPEIADVAVFERADPYWGGVVCAVVVTETLIDYLQVIARERLMVEMRPKQWLRVASIPRTAAGKIDRQLLVNEQEIGDAQ